MKIIQPKDCSLRNSFIETACLAEPVVPIALLHRGRDRERCVCNSRLELQLVGTGIQCRLQIATATFLMAEKVFVCKTTLFKEVEPAAYLARTGSDLRECRCGSIDVKDICKWLLSIKFPARLKRKTDREYICRRGTLLAALRLCPLALRKGSLGRRLRR